jgi:hypothetical protein
MDGAWADLMIVHRLSRLASQGATLIEYTMAVVTDMRASRPECEIIRVGGMTKDQALNYLRSLESMSPIPDPTRTLDCGERLFALDTVTLIAREGLDKAYRRWEFERPREDFTLPDVELDYDWWVRAQNRLSDEATHAAKIKTFAERKQAFATLGGEVPKPVQEVIREVESRSAPRERLRLLIRKVGTRDRTRLTEAVAKLDWAYAPELGRLIEIADMARAERDLALVGLALAAYRGERGEYPQNLPALVPGYLKQVPNDVFSDKPLVYRREGAGYVLYALGPNMTDDGGENDEGKKDDIVLRVK